MHHPLKILLFGRGGQVGWELQRSLSTLGELICLNKYSTQYCGDLSNLAELANTVRNIRPDVIVNAAAYTAVDKAQSEPELVRTINALAPGVLAREAQRMGAYLVHYSTDYVFDGSGQHRWKETDAPAPLNIYGQTKLQGEQHIIESCQKHLIFRTSWVYAARGNNFAKTILRLAKEREQLTVIDDQIGTPTGADMLADVTAYAIRHVMQHPEDTGLYHLTASGETSWHHYAQFVIDYARRIGMTLKVDAEKIAPVSSSAFQTKAVRPQNSKLDTTKLQSIFNLALPHWQQGVARMLDEILDLKKQIV